MSMSEDLKEKHDAIDASYVKLIDMMHRAVRENEIVTSAIYDKDYFDCFIEHPSEDEEFLILTGSRWHKMFGKSKMEIASTPMYDLMDEEHRDWALSKLRMRSKTQNSKGVVYPWFETKWKGKDGPVYIKWIDGRPVDGDNSLWFWRADDSDEESFIAFMNEFGGL